MVIAPELWKLMETLHAANSWINHQRAWTQKRSKKMFDSKGEESQKRKGPEGDIVMENVQVETVWELDNEDNVFELVGEEDDEPEDIQEQATTLIL